MSALVTGNAYVRALTAADDDRTCRAAFLDLALRLGVSRGEVLDFGCGPGLDARVYAEQGWRVYGFDIDAAMCTYFRECCARDIEAQRIRLVECSYAEFLDSAARGLPPLDLITANFAPLNLVSEPAALFRRFAALLKPSGRVLASVLNPLYRGDARYSWWWSGLPQLLARGRYSVAGAQAPITRWLPRRLAQEAAPALELEAVYAPAPRGSSAALAIRPGAPSDWPALSAARYLFLCWRPVGPA
jgi:SAM-dependent methyltransferase